MKQLFIILITCFSCNFISAQEKIEITGQVKDNNTKSALEFCNISVLNTKDSLITGAVTNFKGFFSVSLNGGYYRFVFSFIGYKSDTSDVIPISENKFIGVIKLKPNVNFLNEVSVSESSRENQLDRDVQVVSDKLKEGTSNTKEVLDKINGVDYDRYNNSIKVDNNSKVIILVDGIEKDQEYIKNLSPDRLKKIEVIRDPGGRYALEGYSAVINIILKKDYRGTEIFISDRAMADADAIKSEYIPVQNEGSATINYVYNKVNVYAKYSNNYNNFNFNSTGEKEYNNGLIIEKNPVSENDMNTKIKQFYLNYTLGADYYINPKHTLSYEGMLMKQPPNNNVNKEVYEITYSKNDSLLNSFNSESWNKSGTVNSYNYLFYEGKLNENNIINSNFTFSNYYNKYTNKYNEILLFQRNEDGNNVKNSTKFYLEYLHTLNNKTSLQFGYGNTWENLNSNFTVESVKSEFNYTDIRHKLYSYFSWKLNDKFSVKFGGAGETSSPNANGQKNSYLIFQPYTDIKYSVSKMLNFKAKYRASSNYPNISQTNPYTYIIDQQSVITGNPLLHPEVTNKISLQTTILQGLVQIEPYYHFSNNYITEIGTLRTDSIFEYNYSNAGNYKNYGVEASLTIPSSKTIFFQSSFDFFKSSVKYNGRINEFNDWSMTTQLIYQNQKSKTVAGFQYQNNLRKYITAQGYNKGDNDFWILFVQQPFFKEKLSIMLLYFTPIAWGVDFYQGSYIKTDTYAESKWYNIDILKNIFMFEISYRFNKGKTVNKKEKEVEQINEKKSKGLF
ncbi:MAG: hypothetical protein COX07_06105 [Bacteroidetes bacterium CG23_combo_of_CG06-09_8_20_14_all_32_9]|nr:MAG: hypothetical protein COX07_06105 [Bacteroidetes bacterium CG23_combo_of_CG06-09_8_20_14_all_32_9]